MTSNYDQAMKDEAKKVTRCFHLYDSNTRADHAASHRLGYQQRRRTGEYFYVHPNFPNTAFKTRGDAARAALTSGHKAGASDA